MSILRSDSIKNRAGTGAPDFPNGATVTGVVTATTFKGGAEITSGTAAFSGNVSVGGVLSYEDVTNVDSVGVVTARSNLYVGSAITCYASTGIVSATAFHGDAANLTNLPASAPVGTGTDRVFSLNDKPNIPIFLPFKFLKYFFKIELIIRTCF